MTTILLVLAVLITAITAALLAIGASVTEQRPNSRINPRSIRRCANSLVVSCVLILAAVVIS